MNIYERIKELCRNNGNLRVCDLEKQLKLTENLLSKWAKASPSIDNLLKVANYFNVSLDYFVGRTVQQDNITNTNGIIANGSVSNIGNNSNNSFSPNDNQHSAMSELDKLLFEISKDLSAMQKIDVVNYVKSIKN